MEKEKIFFNHDDNAKILSSFFSNVIKFLGISQNDWEAFKEEIRDTTLKTILKYRCHPIIYYVLAINILPFSK